MPDQLAAPSPAPQDTLIIEGAAWTITACAGPRVRAERTVVVELDADTAETRVEHLTCAARDVRRIGPGLWGLAGRLEPPAVRAGVAVAAPNRIALQAE